jgi:hypothetical protein
VLVTGVTIAAKPRGRMNLQARAGRSRPSRMS